MRGNHIAPFRAFSHLDEIGIHAEDGTMTHFCLAWPDDNGAWRVLTGHYDLSDAESDPEHFIPEEVLDEMLLSHDYHSIEDLKLRHAVYGEDAWKDALTDIVAHAQYDSRFEVPNTYRDRDAALSAISRFAKINGAFFANLKENLETWMQDAETRYRLEHPKEITAVLIPTGELPKKITVRADEGDSFLHALQKLVGGYIEAFGALTEDGMCLYVNDEGLFTCPPNRAIYATEEMEGEYSSQLDYTSTVKTGDFYTVLHGNIVAVGTDMETGEDISLTDDQIHRVTDYFTEVSDPESGAFCHTRIALGLEPGRAPELSGASPLEKDYAEKNPTVAVGVGYSFALVGKSELAGIEVRETSIIVTVNETDYRLLKGMTYADSRDIDRLLDTHGEMRVGAFRKHTEGRGDGYGLDGESRDVRDAKDQMTKEREPVPPARGMEVSHGDSD